MEVSGKKSNEKLVRTLTIISAIVLLITITIVKFNVESFSVTLFLIIIILIVFLAGGIIVAFHYIQKNKEEKIQTEEQSKKLPPAISLEQAREIAVQATQNPTYADYIPHCLGESVEQIGKIVKSNIYIYKARGVYQPNLYVVMLNMHFPNQMRTILIDPKENEIHRAKMLLANYPEDEPNIKRTVTENPLLGTRQVTEESITPPEEPKKEEEKKEKDI